MNFKMLSRDELFELQSFLSSIKSNLNPTQEKTYDKLTSCIDGELQQRNEAIAGVVFKLLNDALRCVRNQYDSGVRDFSSQELAEIAEQEFEHIIANGKPFG